MKEVRIICFKTKNQERIKFVQALAQYDSLMGLKMAKQKMDEMLTGRAIEVNISDERIEEFLEKLDTLELKYEVLR